MKKLEITEVQIEKCNDTYNKLVKFDSGLNVVTGENEAGKSTLMGFITNILVKKSNAEGYLKCCFDGEDIKLEAKKSKQKNNLPCLEKITSKNFEHGFFIDLDDLMQVKKGSENLIEIIKDSSGTAINDKQSEYYDKIYGKKDGFTLTPGNSVSTQLKQQFANLRELTSTIKNLQAQEEEYSEKTALLKQLQLDVEKLKSEIEFIEISLEQKKLETGIASVDVNRNLLENAELFKSVRERFYALKSEFNTVLEYRAELKTLGNRREDEVRKLARIQDFDEDDLKGFDLSQGIRSQELQSDILKSKSDLENIEDKIVTKQSQIHKVESELATIREKIALLNISDMDEYLNDRNTLKKYLENYNRRREETIVNPAMAVAQTSRTTGLLLWLFVGLIVSGVALAALKLFVMAICIIVISGLGLWVCMRENAVRQELAVGEDEEIRNYRFYMKSILEKYETDVSQDIPIMASVLIDKMDKNITEFNSLQSSELSVSRGLGLESDELNELVSKKALAEGILKSAQDEVKKFLELHRINDIRNYADVVDSIRAIREIDLKIDDKRNYVSNFEAGVDEFVSEINRLINDAGITTVIEVCRDEYENFEKTVNDIQVIFDETIKLNAVLEKQNSDLVKLNERLNSFSGVEVSVVSEEVLGCFRDELAVKSDECAILQNELIRLNEVESLVELKNKKVAEINRVKRGLNNLFVKEVVYGLIKKSKEQFNKIQPNLMSAEEYLGKITGGKYTKIDFDNMTISGSGVAEKGWNDLSRGTREQLYLALRLGYAANYSRDKDGAENGRPNMPVIIDDAFVNFDRTRTCAILRCLEEFSKSNQVLYFTCHSRLVEQLLADENIDYNHIEL